MKLQWVAKPFAAVDETDDFDIKYQKVNTQYVKQSHSSVICYSVSGSLHFVSMAMGKMKRWLLVAFIKVFVKCFLM